MKKSGFVMSTYVYMLLVFFLLVILSMLSVLNNSRLLSNKLKENISNFIKLTVILNGGSTTQIFEESYEPGSEIVLEIPTKENNVFVKWSLNEETDSKIENGNLILGKKDTVLTAVWVENTIYSSVGTHTYVVPETGYYQIEAWGASGGNATYGGKGAYTRGKIYLTEGETLYVHVGGEGPSNETVTNVGGYNGGGYSGDNSSAKSYGGGGATDVRLSSGSWNDATGLSSRIMVAAGGAGTASVLKTKAGSGGGLIGGNATSSSSTYNNSTYLPLGATQTGAGYAYQTSSRQGSFGYAKQSNASGYGGGGGGGYYGGGTGHGTTGSGGSSFISGHTGSVALLDAYNTFPRLGTNGTSCTTGTTDNLCSVHYSNKVFIETLMIDGDGYTWTNTKASSAGTNLMPNPSGGTYASGVGHTGNGYAKITYVSS